MTGRPPSTPEQLDDACRHATHLLGAAPLLRLVHATGQATPAGARADDIAPYIPPHIVIEALAGQLREQTRTIGAVRLDHDRLATRVDRWQSAIDQLRQLAPEQMSQLGLLDQETGDAT